MKPVGFSLAATWAVWVASLFFCGGGPIMLVGFKGKPKGHQPVRGP